MCWWVLVRCVVGRRGLPGGVLLRMPRRRSGILVTRCIGLSRNESRSSALLNDAAHVCRTAGHRDEGAAVNTQVAVARGCDDIRSARVRGTLRRTPAPCACSGGTRMRAASCCSTARTSESLPSAGSHGFDGGHEGTKTGTKGVNTTEQRARRCLGCAPCDGPSTYALGQERADGGDDGALLLLHRPQVAHERVLHVRNGRVGWGFSHRCQHTRPLSSSVQAPFRTDSRHTSSRLEKMRRTSSSPRNSSSGIMNDWTMPPGPNPI